MQVCKIWKVFWGPQLQRRAWQVCKTGAMIPEKEPATPDESDPTDVDEWRQAHCMEVEGEMAQWKL